MAMMKYSFWWSGRRRINGTDSCSRTPQLSAGKAAAEESAAGSECSRCRSGVAALAVVVVIEKMVSGCCCFAVGFGYGVSGAERVASLVAPQIRQMDGERNPGFLRHF